MMHDFFKDAFDKEIEQFSREVRARAAELVRMGVAAPFDAIDKARSEIMQRRRDAVIEGKTP